MTKNINALTKNALQKLVVVPLYFTDLFVL